MATEESMSDSLSRNVTLLAQAIDPTSTHGPETEKIAAYAIQTRQLGEKLAVLVISGNREAMCEAASELLKHLQS